MIKEILHENLVILKRNGGNLLFFEALYKLLAMIIVTPLLVLLLNLAIKQAGFQYLADDNIKQVMTNPLTLLIILFLLFLGAMYSLIEMSALIVNFHDGRLGQKIGPVQMLIAGLERAKAILKPGNFMLVIFVLIIIPMTGAVVVSGFMSTIEIPEFIMDTIYTTPALFAAFACLILVFVIAATRWIFSIHSFILERKSFSQSRKISSNMVKGRFWKIIGLLILWNVIVIAAFAVVYGVLIGIAALGIKLLAETNMALAIFLSFFRVANLVMLFLAAAVGVPFNFSFISTLYYRFRGEDMPKEKILPPRAKPSKLYESLVRNRKPILITALIVAVISNGIVFYGMAKYDAFGQVEGLKLPQITSHRGDSVAAPENTIPAFDSAIKNMADYAELDVRQTKDGVVVVIHDDSLKRTTGVNKQIWQLTYDEVKKLDAGSWFGKQFKGTHIPTLDEVIKHCKGRIKLNIELKPNGHDPNLEEATLKVIKENNFRNQCVLTSLTYKSLVKAKKLNPDIKTGYILSVAYGDFYDMPYLDFFSVDASFITHNMVKELHSRGKEVHAWTVDNEENMRKMAELKVDNLITDDAVKARKVIYEIDTNSTLTQMLQQIFENK